MEISKSGEIPRKNSVEVANEDMFPEEGRFFLLSGAEQSRHLHEGRAAMAQGGQSPVG